jgi:hypothetical protein
MCDQGNQREIGLKDSQTQIVICTRDQGIQGELSQRDIGLDASNHLGEIRLQYEMEILRLNNVLDHEKSMK